MNFKTVTLVALLTVNACKAPPAQPQKDMRSEPSVVHTTTVEDPYAFRESPSYIHFWQKMATEVQWDYGIDVKKGDTLWGIAGELYGKHARWREIRDQNIEVGVFPEHFKPRTLQPGRRLFVYLPLNEESSYRAAHPDRNLTKWPHTKDCAAFVGKKCDDMRKYEKGEK